MNKRKNLNKLETAYLFGKITRKEAKTLSKLLNMEFNI